MQLAIAIPLPDPVAREVVGLQLDLARRYGFHGGLACHPHITLKLGFPTREIRRFETFLEQQAGVIPALRIKIGGVGFFDQGIAFLDVEPNAGLEAVRRRIVDGLRDDHGVVPEEIEDSRFRFHVTLVSEMAPGRFRKVRDELAGLELDFEFEAARIDLLCHVGSHWIVCRRLELKPVADNEANGKRKA